MILRILIDYMLFGLLVGLVICIRSLFHPKERNY